MWLIASAVLTLTFQFEHTDIPDAEVQVLELAVTGQRLPLNPGFSGGQPYSFALTPSATSQEIHFALREYNANCIHNGVIDLPQPFTQTPFTISATFRITQNTCAYATFATAGQTSVTITASKERAALPNASKNTLTYEPLGRSLKHAPWAPQPPQAQPTVYGWSRITNDQQFEHYSSNTHIAVPAYSLSKTFITTATALLYRKQHQTGLLQMPLYTWGDICPQNTWQSVTLIDALNMQTGHYASKQHGQDEASAAMIENFFEATTHQEKIAHACSYPEREQRNVVYQTSATYLAATALQNLLSTEQNTRLDTFLYNGLWNELKLSPLAYSIDTTKDDTRQVWGGYGLTLLPTDLVKLAHFVQQDPLKLGFEEILENPETAYPIPNRPNLRYHQSIWFWQHPDTQKWYPFLSGYGGIIVLFLDDKHIYYMVSDQHDHRFKSVIDSFENYQRQRTAPRASSPGE